MKLPEIYNTEVFKKLNVRAKHQFAHSSGSFVIRSFVEDHVFYDADGREEAVISTIAYTK